MSSFQRTFLPHVDDQKEETDRALETYDECSVHPTKHGRYIISTGHPQLDRIIGGFELHTLTFWTHRVDQILGSGSCVSLIQDLSRYFVAEGILSNQTTIILTKDIDEGNHFIKDLIPAAKPLSNSTTSKENATKTLNIAWQYGKYLDTNSQPHKTKANKFCHQFDLSQRMSSQQIDLNRPIIVSVSEPIKTDIPSHLIACDYFVQLFDALKHQIQLIVNRHMKFRVIRINILQIVPKLSSSLHEIQTEFYHFLRKLKLLTSQYPIVCFLPTQLYNSSDSFQHVISHTTDYNFNVQSFTGEKAFLPIELSSFDGILTIDKISNSHSLASNSLDAVRLGLVRNSRKLKIEKMHLPPAISRSNRSNESQPEIKNCSNLF